MTQKKKKDSIHNLIVETLGRKIVFGEIEPGMPLGNDATTGELFDASRTAAREALKILGSKGLIESRPKVGTMVLGRERWSCLDPQILTWRLQDPKQSRHTMLEIYEFRMAFEPFAAAAAARSRSENDIVALRRALRGMAHYYGSEDRTECDLAFHMAILEATGNTMFRAVGELISVGLRHLFKTGFEATSEEDEHWLKSHREVADAIENKKEQKASSHMLQLLMEAKSNHAKRDP